MKIENALVCCVRQIDTSPLVVRLSNHERAGSSFVEVALRLSP